MRTKILSLLLSLIIALTFTACIDSESSSNSNSSIGTTIEVYNLTVNDVEWAIYNQKIFLIDNAKENPETYEYDYTLRILATDASNMINQESKILNINFNAEDVESLKDANFTDCDNFHILYRAKMQNRAQAYYPTAGVMTITKIEDKKATIVFNNLTVEAENTNTLLPGIETPKLKIHGEIKCSI